MIPIEGIDKIKVSLNPFFINYANKKHHIDPQNRLTLHKAGCFTLLAIHAEFCNPLIDYRMNIALAIYELIKAEVIAFPDEGPLTLGFVYHNLDWFICGVQELEFYFNIRPSNITVDEGAVENGDLVKYHNTLDTLYTPDHNEKGKNKRKSIGIIYDKEAKDLKDNHIKHETLEQHPYKMRLEFRLNSMNCNYLSLNNLRGNYKEIIKRYCGYLGIQYGLYFRDCVKITGRDNKQLKRIEAKSKDAGQRYRGKELEKTPPIKVSARDADSEGREQMQTMLRRRFYSELENTEKAPK
jgi:hypothetical protein